MPLSQNNSTNRLDARFEVFLAEERESSLRFDLLLVARIPGVSRSRIQALIRDGHALLNGETAKTSETVRVGDRIAWRNPPVEAAAGPEPEDIPLRILHEDESFLVIDKAAGLVVHPGAGNTRGTLVSALLHHGAGLSENGGPGRPGIVHRLDKETSGCLVVAKTDRAHRALADQFSGRLVEKTYLAVVCGAPRPPDGRLATQIGRHPKDRQRMAVDVRGRGRDAVTDYKTVETNGAWSLVECRPRTGRTHQIRVHLKHLGSPVAGDPVYGRRGAFERHFLHAWKIAFEHPETRSRVSFEAPMPPEFAALLRRA